MALTKRLVLTPGESAGIGPDLVLEMSQKDWPHQLVICADRDLMKSRSQQLGLSIEIIDYDSSQPIKPHQAGQLLIAHLPLTVAAVAGQLNIANSQYVLDTLDYATQGCLSGEFAAVVTGPVHKGIINHAGVPFSGHTEFFAEKSNTPQVVMMLATEGLRVSLVTTHIPLANVADAITPEKLKSVIRILHADLVSKFGIMDPKIYVCGLNPHAGEDGCLGRNEIDIITPTLNKLRSEEGMTLIGPLPADTVFQPKYLDDADTVLTMYHDQGLPVLKFKGFGKSVNITLGLPFIRTSVDHGTALELAGTGQADTGSLWTALSHALNLVEKHT